MMLPATIPSGYRLLPAMRVPRANVLRLREHFAPALFEFAAFGGFIAVCIGLMAEFS